MMNTKGFLSTLTVIVAALSLGACASTEPTTSGMMQSDYEQKLAQLEAREQAIEDERMYLSGWEDDLGEAMIEIDQDLAAAESAKEQAFLARQEAMGSGESLFPPGAELGHCYARLFIPAEYQTVTEKVLKKEAGEQVNIIPARYETVSEQVLVEEASQRLEVIPAQFAWVEEKVLVKPASYHLEQVPAQFATVNEQVMVKPAQLVWKKGTGPIQRIDAATGEILCLVEEPAQFRTVSKRVMISPASTNRVEEPAVYKTVKKRVLSSPASTKMVEIPAKYKTVQVTKLVEPAREERIPVAAQFQTVTKQIKVGEDHMAWKEILCQTNTTPGKVSQIQQALLEKGYNPGPIDGVVGPKTMAAVNAFQADNKLAVGDYLTISTIKALGVSPQ